MIGLSASDQNLHQRIINIRKELKLKLPDAIILATALEHQAMLITNDDSLLESGGTSILRVPKTN